MTLKRKEIREIASQIRAVLERSSQYLSDEQLADPRDFLAYTEFALAIDTLFDRFVEAEVAIDTELFEQLAGLTKLVPVDEGYLPHLKNLVQR